MKDMYILLEDAKGKVSPMLFGSNIEHTRGCIYGGLSAQMLKNRKFAGKPERSGCCHDWFPVGDRGHFGTCAPYTCHVQSKTMNRRNECQAQRMNNMADGFLCSICQHHVDVRAGENYQWEMVIRCRENVDVKVTLASASGERYAEHVFHVPPGGWQSYACTLCPNRDDKNADILITFTCQTVVDVGAVSLLPENHFRGMRRDVVDLLKQTGVKLLRWPGGNFAGEYRWMDGLLPVHQRGPLQAYMEDETQTFSHGYDFHEINTDDFIALCREVGATPFITINPAWDTPEECAHWVEYCNGDENTPYGKMRMERGNKEPYNVALWSLGNEFGYAHMEGSGAPEDYARNVRRYAQAMLNVSKDLTFVSSGQFEDRAWFTHSALPLSDIAPLFSHHHYTSYMRDGDDQGEVDFVEDLTKASPPKIAALKSAYENMLQDVKNSEKTLESMQNIIGDKLRISFDEWNVWYAWYRAPGAPEGLFAALMLHMLMRRAQALHIGLGCYFEMINEGAIAVLPHEAHLTPCGHAFAMMKDHIGGSIRYADDQNTVLVTDHEGKRVYTLVNPAFDEEKTFCLPECAQINESVLYTSTGVHPGSYFEQDPLACTLQDQMCVVTLPARSMAKMELRRKNHGR